jgi:hypothetical protein
VEAAYGNWFYSEKLVDARMWEDQAEDGETKKT